MADAFTTLTPAQCRAQMPLYNKGTGPTSNLSKLETGSTGKGRNYVKVWRGKEHFLWFWFDTKTEALAFKKATEAMRANPGSKWATEKPALHECKSIPSMLPKRERKKVAAVVTPNQIKVLKQMLNGEAMRFTKRANTGQALINHGFATYAPGVDREDWLLVITDAGRAEVGDG